MKLTINNFDKLSIEDQEELQNLITGITTDFETREEFSIDLIKESVKQIGSRITSSVPLEKFLKMEGIKFLEFKSIDPFFTDEKQDLKNNTVRILDQTKNKDLERINIIKDYIENQTELWIKITNPDTKKSFIRRIRNACIYMWGSHIMALDCLYILTWEPLKKQENSNGGALF